MSFNESSEVETERVLRARERLVNDLNTAADAVLDPAVAWWSDSADDFVANYDREKVAMPDTAKEDWMMLAEMTGLIIRAIEYETRFDVTSPYEISLPQVMSSLRTARNLMYLRANQEGCE